MKIYQIIIIALCALFVFGCNGTANSSANSAANSTTAAMTPTETLKTFIEASKTKNTEAMKKTMSKGTLALIEKSAKEQNTTVEELMKKDDGTPLKEMPETRNERIEGDTATVEAKNKVTGEFDKIPFVKEEGAWKIALDKLMDDLMRQMAEDMKSPAATNSKSGGITEKSNSNKAETNK